MSRINRKTILQLKREINELQRQVNELREEQHVRYQLEKLGSINVILLSALRTMSLYERLRLIAFHASEILGTEACTVLLVKRPGFLRHEASFGYDLEKFPLGTEFQILNGEKTGLTGAIAALGIPFKACGDELLNHPAVKGDLNAPTIHNCYSLLMIPLQEDHSGEIIGWIRADNKKDQNRIIGPHVCFSEGDMAIASIFADIVVTAIRTAQIVDELDILTAVAPYGVIAHDSNGLVSHANQLALNLFDYTSDQITGMHVSDLYTNPDEAHQVGRRLNRSFNHRIENFETYVRTRANVNVQIRLSAVQLRDPFDQRSGTIGYFQDLSEINKVQAALIQERRLLRKLIDQIPDYVYVKDEQGRFVEVNKEAAMRMGAEDPRELIGKTDFDYYPLQFAQSYREIEINVMQTQHPIISHEEAVMDMVTGDIRTLLTTKVPWIDDETNQVKGVIGIGRDFTRFRRVYDASNNLIRLDTPEEILETTLHLVHETSNADWVSIVLFGTIPSDQALLNFPYKDAFRSSHIRPDGLSMEIFETRRPIIIPDIKQYTESPGLHPLTKALGFQAIIGLPMSIKDKSIGVIWIHYTETQNFTDEMLQNVEFYVHQATVAFDRLQRIASDKQMRTAFTAVVEATAAGDYQTTLEAIAQGVKTALACDAVTLYSYDPETNKLNFNPTMKGVNDTTAVFDPTNPVRDPFVHDMFRLRDILIVPNTSEHERFKERPFVKREKITSCLVVPIRESTTNEAGVLFVNYRRRHVFTEDEITNVRLFAAQAAVALNNARLNSARERLFVNLAHEVHLPITSIMSDSEVLRDELEKTNLKHLYTLAQHNLGEVERAALVTDTLLKTLGKDIPWQPVFTKHSIYRPLIEAYQMFEGEARANGCEIREPKSIGGFPSILMSLQDITIAFKNIIGNAVKYSYRSNNHFIRIEGFRDKRTPNYYTVSIQNYGVGITEEEIRTEKIFTLYYRGVNASERHRTGGGIGLAHAMHVIRHLHRGDIVVESKPQEGGAYLTTFRVLLPLN